MPEETNDTAFITKQGLMSKAAIGALVHVMAIVAIMFAGTVCVCELYLCYKDPQYKLPNEMWIIVMSIVGFLYGKKVGEPNKS